jgi:hypothetical protein
VVSRDSTPSIEERGNHDRDEDAKADNNQHEARRASGDLLV